jgi:outer membrane protein TolC
MTTMTSRKSLVLAGAAVLAFGAPAFAQRLAPPEAQPNQQPAQQRQGGLRRQVLLREALQLAARQGPDVAAARAQAAIAQAGVERAWTSWQPDVVATGTYDHTDGVQKVDLSPFFKSLGLPGNAFPPTTIVAQNNYYATVQLSQPLLTPQGLFLPGIASNVAEAAARGADEAREQVLLSVARAYLGLQGLEGLLAAARDAEKVALRREQDAKAQIAAGTAVEINLLRAQTETAQARAQIAGLLGEQQSLLPVLEALTGEAIQPAPIGQQGEDLGGTADESTQPWESSFSVRSASAAVKASRGSVRLDSLLWMPTVAGVARESYNSNSGFSGKNWVYDLMINVSVPIYDRGTRYAAKHEDEARLAQAVAQLASARARARSNWLGARANLAAAEAVLAQTVAQAQLAARAQSQVDASARAGVATSLDLSDADAKKFGAESAAAQARAALEIRKAEVAAAEGRLYSTIAR